MYRAKNLAPHHQYVAAYAWLRQRIQGRRRRSHRHARHARMAGRQGRRPLRRKTPPDALIADLPDLYIYNVDVVGEGLVARRRGMAALIDHMVPPFKKGGMYPELAALRRNDQRPRPETRARTSELAKVYLTRDPGIRWLCSASPRTSGLDLIDKPRHPRTKRRSISIENHLLGAEGPEHPLRPARFGRTPEKPLRDSTIDAIVSADRTLLPEQGQGAGRARSRSASWRPGARELDVWHTRWPGGFAGRAAVASRSNPDAYPTGKNFYGIDPDKVPKPASWESA